MVDQVPEKVRLWPAILFCAGALFLVVGVPSIMATIQGQRWADASGTSPLQLSDLTESDYFRVDARAELETWAEYSQTALRVYVHRLDSQRRTRTPRLSASLSDGTRCAVSRNYQWSTPQGATLELLCNRYLTFDTLSEIESGSISESR